MRNASVSGVIVGVGSAPLLRYSIDKTSYLEDMFANKYVLIGYKRILRFPEVTASRLRIRITDAWEAPCLAEIQVFKADHHPLST